MIPRPLLKALLDGWEDPKAIAWPELLTVYGDGCRPMAGWAPPEAGLAAPWRQQVLVEALSHLGTLQLIRSWQMPFVAVKGIAWGASLWGDPLARPARDLDLAVQPADVPAWQRCLEGAGFEAPRSAAEWVRGRQIVQLHYPHGHGPWLNQVQPPWQAFLSRAEPVMIGPVAVGHLDPPDTLLYLAHHQVYRHALDHDLGWLDLAGWLRWAPAGAVAEAVRRSAGTHLERALSVLAWAWRKGWYQEGLSEVPAMSWRLAPWALRAMRRRGDRLAAVGLALALTQGEERWSLLRAAPAGWRRWRRWGQ